MVVEIHNRADNPPRFYFREWRLRKGLTQEQVAERMDSNKSTISQLEHGRKGATEAKIFGFAAALGIAPEQLFRHPDAPTLDDLLREADAETRNHVLGIVRALTKAANAA